MRKIDRLIIKARNKFGYDRLTGAFIYPSEEEPEQWVARADIWNGIIGSGIKSEFRTCPSIDDALQALEEIADKYPNDRDITIFIDDLKE